MKVFNWIGRALSDKLEPSTRRLIALILILVIAYCEIYNTHKKGEFDTTHLKCFLLFISVILGAATIQQIVQLVRGGPAPVEQVPPAQPEAPAQ